MTVLPRDSVWADRPHPDPGEEVLAEFPADPAAYWRGHLRLAVLGGAAAGLGLMAIGNPHPWVGPVATLPAILGRAAFLKSEALAGHWILTRQRLLGPGGRVVPLTAIRSIRPFFGDAMIVTITGDKHLMKYMAYPSAVIATIERARP
ncbi:MAG: hypothetical protein QM656_12180 [Paracoccaceae bacterium]